MSIICKHKEIDGAALVRLIARAAELKEKAGLLEQQEVERTVSRLDRFVKYLGLLAGAVFGSMVLIQVVKAVLR